ncbi:MAG: GxxExxY protein [Chitinophagaceae bacterium]
MEINELTGLVVDLSVKIHSNVGPGCFERVYEELLYYEMQKRNLTIHRQLLMPISYDDLLIRDAYKLDLLVDNRLIIEIKSVEHVSAVHFKQLQTYLKLMKLKNGMLLNFKTELMRDGIFRVFNNSGNLHR